MGVGLYAGSFDPVHLGHVAIVEAAAKLFDEVVVAVVANPRKSRGLFTVDERLRLLTDATSHLPTVRARAFEGLTIDLAREERAFALVRAVHKEAADEWSMAAMNLTAGLIPTTFLPANVTTRAISSSLIRELVAAGHVADAQELVPPCVRRALVDVAPLHIGSSSDTCRFDG
jgi:pantetheine-phosphate adenylyltransferase